MPSCVYVFLHVRACTVKGCICIVYLNFCVCVGFCVYLTVCMCKCIKHTGQIGPLGKKKKKALIAGDFVEDLKGIIPVYRRARESETKTRW